MTIIILLSVESMRQTLLTFHNNSVIIAGAVLLLLFLWVSILAFLSHVTFYDFVDMAEYNSVYNNGNVHRKTNTYNSLVKEWILSMVLVLSAPVRILVKDIFGMHVLNCSTQNTQPQKKHQEKESCSARELELFQSEMKEMESRMKEIQAQTKIEMMSQIRCTEQRLEQIMKIFMIQNSDNGGGKPRASGYI